jgi:hypothetical protein
MGGSFSPESPGLDFSPVGDVEAEEKIARRAKSRVLFAFAHGDGVVLVCEEGAPLSFVQENGNGASEDGFVLSKEGIDVGLDPDVPGVYFGVLGLVDDGPGDYPGTREFAVSLSEVRDVTAEEWKAHLAGEWPWEVEP